MTPSGSNMRRLILTASAGASALALAGCGVNAIPTKDEAVKARWGDVQNAYQRRSDLIPNLVATVQAAGAQERGTLVDVQNARSKATQMTVDPSYISDPAKLQQYQAAQGQLSQALGRLLSVTENYPQLQTNQNFLALQSQIEGTENRINVSRKDYNDAVQDYNTTLRTFPTVIWAKTLYGSQKIAQPFAATESAQSAPKVTFNIPPAGGAGAPPSGAPAAAAMPGATTTTTTTSNTTSTQPAH